MAAIDLCLQDYELKLQVKLQTQGIAYKHSSNIVSNKFWLIVPS